MDLANELTYSGKLKCVSDKVANNYLTIDAHYLQDVCYVYCRFI